MGVLDKLKGLPNLNELKGSFGEQLTKYYAKIMTDTLILHDVLIDGADGLTSQIDLLMIGAKGIYVVEVKMYANARIYGDGKKSKWYYYLGGKRYEIYSPLKQNEKHIQYLKTFFKQFGDIPCFSILNIMCDDFKVTNINDDPNNRTTVICSSLPAMHQAIKIIAKDKPIFFSDEKRKEIYEFILNNQHQGKQARIEHKEKLQEIKNTQENLKEQRICPYCQIPLKFRKGKYGDFYGCVNYPKCKYTQKV